MPLMDFISIWEAAKGGNIPSLFGTKFSVNLGQSLTGCIGPGRQTHILGQELKLVTDPSSWISGSALWSLLTGAAGKTELYYGRNSGMTYVGPKFDINRSADWALAVVKTASLRPTTGAETLKPSGAIDKPAGAFGQNAVDTAAVAGATAMGLIINGVAFGLDIAARIKFGDGKDPPNLFYLLNTLSMLLTSRLLAVMEIIEVAAAWTNLGQGVLGFVKVLLSILLTAALTAATVTIIPIGITLGICVLAEHDMLQGIEDAFKAIWAIGH